MISRIDLSGYGFVVDDETIISLVPDVVEYKGQPIGKILRAGIDGQSLILEIELDEGWEYPA